MGRAQRTVERVQLTRLRFFALAMSGNASGDHTSGQRDPAMPFDQRRAAHMRAEANIPLLCHVGAAGRIRVDYVR